MVEPKLVQLRTGKELTRCANCKWRRVVSEHCNGPWASYGAYDVWNKRRLLNAGGQCRWYSESFWAFILRKLRLRKPEFKVKSVDRF